MDALARIDCIEYRVNRRVVLRPDVSGFIRNRLVGVFFVEFLFCIGKFTGISDKAFSVYAAPDRFFMLIC